MIDSHCHLDLPAFENDWQQVLQQAKQQGLTRLLIPGTHPRYLAHQHHICVNAAAIMPVDVAWGFHPYFISEELKPSHIQAALEQAFASNLGTPVAIGEIGLDGQLATPMSQQQACFEAQLAFAKSRQLPVILHHRKSHHLLFSGLKAQQFNQGGVVHAFSGSIEVAKTYLEMGFYLGFGGTITYPRGAKTRKTLEYVLACHPERVLIETDAPDMPMQGRQGQRNSPAYLGDVVSAIATLSGNSKQAIVTLTSENYLACFGLTGTSSPI